MKKVLFGIGIAAIAVGIFVLGIYNQNLRESKDTWFSFVDVTDSSQGQSNFATSPATQEICDPAYPDICVPPFPPDIDCSDVEFTKFRVYQPDPHGLDPDMNGVGCE